MDLAADKVNEFQKLADASQVPTVMNSVHALAGLVAYWSKDYEKAIGDLKLADPEDQYARYYLALADGMVGKNQEARDLYAGIAKYNHNGLMYALVRPSAAAKSKA